jgi:hypothetical protein
MSQPFRVQMANRPGELARLTRALAARDIDIRQISGGSSGPATWAFLTTDNEEATREVLRGLGYPFLEGPTVTVTVGDTPGALADLAERLAQADVNVEALVIVGHHGSQVDIAFSVDDERKAREVLGV